MSRQDNQVFNLDTINFGYKSQGYEMQDGHAVFKFQITALNFTLQINAADRYKSMSEFCKAMEKHLGKNELKELNLPKFPPTKWVGSKKDNFIRTREQ